jgi:hypothetical protein
MGRLPPEQFLYSFQVCARLPEEIVDERELQGRLFAATGVCSKRIIGTIQQPSAIWESTPVESHPLEVYSW